MTDPIQQADSFAEELAGIERAAQEAASGRLAAELAALTKKALAASTISPDAFRAVLERLTAIFRSAPERAQRAVQKAVQEAYEAGLVNAVAGWQLDPLDLPASTGSVDVASLAEEQYAAAVAILRSNYDIPIALAVARRAVSRVEAATSWHVHRAASTAVEDTAGRLGLARRWVAERNACVHCLAYQGEWTYGLFDGGLTFGGTPLTTAPVVNPPLHPHCRCIIQLHDPNDTDVIAALKREARRSILRGDALSSESENSRLQAADRLLRAGAGLPKTVEERARRSVKRGSFSPK